MKQISIIAATFYGNRGAEGMLSTTIAEIKAQQKDNNLVFNVFSYYAKKDKSLINDDLIKVYSSSPTYLVLILIPFSVLYQIMSFLRLKVFHKILPASVVALAQSEMLICLAGVSFVAGRTKFLPFNIATILPALILQVPVIKFAQALGPFSGFINKKLAKIFLSRCTRIFTRGEKTHAHIKNLLKDKSNYERADDVVFLFQPEYCKSTAAQGLDKNLQEIKLLKQSSNKNSLIIGICPSIVVAKQAKKNGWDYSQNIADLINELANKDYIIALYPNATRGDDMHLDHNNDLPLLNEINKKIKPETKLKIIKFSDSYNVSQIHQIVNQCDLHIVSRFHAMVTSLSSSIPVLVIGWSHKYIEVMERFNQQDMVIDFKEGSQKNVINLLEKLAHEKQQRAFNINNALIAVRQLSKKQIDFVVQILKNAK